MIVAIDSETYTFDKKDGLWKPTLDARKFVLGCLKTDTGITKFFDNRKEMQDYIIELIEKNMKYGHRTFIYAHNMEYDYYAIMRDYILNDKVQHIVFRPFISIYKQKGYFLDTMAFFRMSLADMGEVIGLPKAKMPETAKNLDQIKPYLERDTKIVLQGVLWIKEKVSKAGFNPRKLLTAGQLAMTSFMTYSKRNGTLKNFTYYDKSKRMMVIHKTKHPKKVRQAFRGANNQCFQIGKFEKVTLIDINGLYGHIMQTMDFPDLKTELYNEQPSVGLLKAYLENHLGVAQITIEAPSLALPYLPIRYAGYQVFVGGRTLKGTWTFLEIQEALKLGYEIKSCDWAIRWNKSQENPLKKFIEFIYEMEKKQETKEAKMPLKLLRNNLYGKFSQNKSHKEYKMCHRKEIREYQKEGYEECGTYQENYIVSKELPPYEPHYVNPIISVLITANARHRLYKELQKMPIEDLIYCDTDSIAFKGNHLHNFQIGNELGQFKIEAKNCKAKFLGEKRYYIDQEAKIAGLSKRERSIELIENEEDIETKKMFGFKEAIKTGKIPEIGKFVKQIVEMKPHSKSMLYIPNKVDETLITDSEVF